MNASRVAGVDACRAGWVCVTLDGGRWSVDVHETIASAWAGWVRAGAVRLVLIDMPIGLRDEGPESRRCEQEARALLGVRRSSVFTPPVRSSLRYCTPRLMRGDYARACASNHAKCGRKLSRQTWGIMPKMREVDRFLDEERSARGVLREAHPELLFCKLNGNQPMRHSKKTRHGFEERLALASRYFAEAERLLALARTAHRRRDVGNDDVLDALIGAIGAQRCLERGIESLPAEPERDSHGLPMEMVYPAP